MSGFTLFRRGECLICSGASNGCRQSLNTGLIFCRDTNSNPTNFIYRGEDVNGFGLWASSEEVAAFTSQAREERERRRQEFITAQAKRQEQRIAWQLSAVDRDKYYRKLLDQLRLSKSDNEKLLVRGFTQKQVIADGYGSVTAWQKVSGEFPHNLPGLLSSNRLNVHTDAILCPIRNQDGLIVGCQSRLNESDSGRYRWLTSATKRDQDGATSHLDGELPLGVFEPADYCQTDSIWITEGTAIKPSLTRHRLNVPVVGAASGRFDTSPETTKAALASLSAKYKTKLLTVAVDAGDVVNQSGVPDRWQQQFKFFASLGYQCRVAWWGQVSKDHCDIDELTDTTVVSYITPDEFLAIVQEHKSPKLVPQPASEDYIADWAWQKWLRSRKFTPNTTFSQDKFTFGNIPKTGAIIAAKSGLGTGKTEALIREIKSSNVGALIIGYRNNLLFQTIDRASQENVAIYHLREDDGHSLVADENTHQAFCLDSIHHVDGYFRGRDIYLDESCSVLLHAVNGGTLGDGQARAIKLLTHGLNVCNRVILSDGNLSDMYADFVAKLAPDKQLIKIENQRKIPPHTIRFIEGVNIDGEVKKRDKSALFKAMFDDNHIPWIGCDSKELTKIIDKIFKQLGKKGYVINSETVGEDWAKEFLNNPNKFIENNKPDYFIVSPSCESGVSVTHKGHFTVKFTFLCGVQGTNSQHQIMFRLRDDTIPHYVFCPEKSMVKDRSNPNTYSSKVFQQIITERVAQSANFAATDSSNPATVEDIIIKAIQRGDNRWWFFACELGALDNFEMDNLRKCLIHALREAGHDVDVIKWEIDDGFKQKAEEAKEAIQLEHSEEIFAAIEYESIDEANKISKTSQRKDIQRRVEKTRLLDRLPGIKDDKNWGADFIFKCHIKDRDFINKQQRFWLLNNFEVSKKRHESNWFYQATKEDFFIASMKRISHSTIWALKELNILQFLKGEWHKNSPEVIEFIQKAKTPEIALALKTQPKVETISGQERIEFLSSLFAMIGIKFKKQCQKTIDGIRQRIYSADSEALDDSYRLATLAAVEIKLTKWMQEKSQIEWVAAAEIDPAISSLVEELVQAESKIKCDELFLSAGEEKKQQAWELLTAEQQNRIWEFYPKPQNFEPLTMDQKSASGQELADTVKVLEPSLESVPAAIQSVDAAILAHEPLCNLESLPTEIKWQRRLGKALALGADSAKNIYQLIPSQLLQIVWQGLTQGVQNSYIQLFEVNNYG